MEQLRNCGFFGVFFFFFLDNDSLQLTQSDLI